MKVSPTTVAAAAGCIALAGGLALAQTTYTPPPVLKLPHGGPQGGVPHVGPARSIKNVPLHPLEASGAVPRLNPVDAHGKVAHIMPSPAGQAARQKAGLVGFANMAYHGGPIMNPYLAYYVIYWAPSTLQSGAATGFSALYGTITLLLAAWYPGHGVSNILTQYYQTISGTTTYIANGGGLGGFVIDTNPYPPSSASCNNALKPNCIGDDQIQSEITNVMMQQGWTGGLNKMFLLFTSNGENSCFNTSSCSYTQYCAYHTYFVLNGLPVIYGNEPYGLPCDFGEPIPNDAAGDRAANAASHEMSEAATDPLLNAWYDAGLGGEIGDKCVFNNNVAQMFGPATWNNATANQMWNGFFFELQMEWDNHANSGAGGCSQVGPQ